MAASNIHIITVTLQDTDFTKTMNVYHIYLDTIDNALQTFQCSATQHKLDKLTNNVHITPFPSQPLVHLGSPLPLQGIQISNIQYNLMSYQFRIENRAPSSPPPLYGEFRYAWPKQMELHAQSKVFLIIRLPNPPHFIQSNHTSYLLSPPWLA